MKIERAVTGMVGTNLYLVSNEETKEAVIIDPAYFPDFLKQHIENKGLKVKAILLTHAHFDHIMGIDQIIETYGSMPVYVEESDYELLSNADLNCAKMFGTDYTYAGGDVIHDGDILDLIGYQFRVIHTPGHTQGGVCYYVESEKVLFSGDTLFNCSVGRTDFPTSSASALNQSIKEKLFVLPDDTQVHPGHMDETTIGFEKENNPFII